MSRERFASSPGAASSSKNISRRCASCGNVALRSRPWTGAGRGTRRGNCPIRARGMSRLPGFRDRRRDLHAARGASPIARRPIMRWRIRWAAPPAACRAFRQTLVRAHGSGRAADRFAAPRSSWPLRMLMRTLRFAGFGNSYVPGSNVDRVRASGFPGNPLTSDPGRYARNAAISNRIRRSALALPRWPGWMRRLIRWSNFGPRITLRVSLRRF